MKNISSKKGWMTGVNLSHVEPPPIPLIKENHDDNTDKDFVELKLHRYPTLSTPDLYEFKMSWLDNV